MDTWTRPGIVLIIGIAVPQFAAAIVALAGGRPDHLGHRLCPAVGMTLVLWIVVQLALLQQFFFLRPIIAGFGLVEIGLAQDWPCGGGGRRTDRSYGQSRCPGGPNSDCRSTSGRQDGGGRSND